MSEKKIYKETEGTIEMSADKLTEFIEARSSGANSDEYQQYHVTQDNTLKNKVDDYQNQILSGNYINMNSEGVSSLDLQISI